MKNSSKAAKQKQENRRKQAEADRQKKEGKGKQTESVPNNSAAEKVSARQSNKEVLYQVKTKRDSAVIKAYITFTYRVLHPGVTIRLIFFGILIAAPAIIAKAVWLKATLLALGALLILLGLFRQYISLALTKRNDKDYQSGIEYTYNFTANDAVFIRGDEITSSISKYKEIISFYYDEDFYYLGIRNRDFFILPKSRFTIGDPEQFEDFIYKKSKKTCKWIPNNFNDQLKKRRAAQAVSANRK